MSNTTDPQPLRVAYSRDEAMAYARAWFITEYGQPREMNNDQRASYHENLGMVTHLIGDMFSESQP